MHGCTCSFRSATEELSRSLKVPNRVVKNDFLLRISIVCLQRRWRRRKNPQRIAEDTPAVFSSSPPRFVKTLKMLTTEPLFHHPARYIAFWRMLSISGCESKP